MCASGRRVVGMGVQGCVGGSMGVGHVVVVCRCGGVGYGTVGWCHGATHTLEAVVVWWEGTL